jgi:hypothetical protein
MSTNKSSRKAGFIGEIISVEFKRPGFILKNPECPDKFIWRGEPYIIAELLNEWHDFTRRDKYSGNMRDAHLIRASAKGSLGVGRFYFRVLTIDNRIFDLYFDRSIKNVYETGGFWVLFQEIFQS